MSKSTKALLIIIVSFGLYYLIDDIFFKDIRKWFFELTNQLGFSHIIAYLITGTLLFLGTLLVGNKYEFFKKGFSLFRVK